MSSWPTWDEWLRSLDARDRQAAVALAARFGELGADGPEEWARSEIGEGIPHLARFLLLRQLRRDAVAGWTRPGAIENLPAATRLLDAGADRADLVQVASAAAYEAVFAVLEAIDEERDPEAPEECPGWRLVEVDESGSTTGRQVGGLHEDFQSIGPSGRDGADLWA
jgi:hypothetical protein